MNTADPSEYSGQGGTALAQNEPYGVAGTAAHVHTGRRHWKEKEKYLAMVA